MHLSAHLLGFAFLPPLPLGFVSCGPCEPDCDARLLLLRLFFPRFFSCVCMPLSGAVGCADSLAVEGNDGTGTGGGSIVANWETPSRTTLSVVPRASSPSSASSSDRPRLRSAKISSCLVESIRSARRYKAKKVVLAR